MEPYYHILCCKRSLSGHSFHRMVGPFDLPAAFEDKARPFLLFFLAEGCLVLLLLLDLALEACDGALQQSLSLFHPVQALELLPFSHSRKPHSLEFTLHLRKAL